MLLTDEALVRAMPYEMFSVSGIKGDDGEFYGVYGLDLKIVGDALTLEARCGYFLPPAVLPTQNMVVTYPVKDKPGGVFSIELHIPRLSSGWELSSMPSEGGVGTKFYFTAVAERGSGVFMRAQPLDEARNGFGPSVPIWEFN